MADKEKPNSVLIGITSDKEIEFSKWYREVLIKAELIDYSNISGCYVLKNTSMGIWSAIQKFIDKEIELMGVNNMYFPLFVTQEALEKEKSHIEGFSPEVAWVTKSGKTTLDKPIAIRPTSETIIYPHFANWIQSHQDLPLKVNQWCNVVRWEFKDPTPFIRSREFLWQEGHTAHLTQEGADQEVKEILNLYTDTYQNLLAVPVIAGIKSEKEKFSGGDYTTTVECFIPTVGKAVQGATSHCLGQNFSKMFDIVVEDQNEEKQYVYQNSWGFTTRSIGVSIMIHSDNKGLVLPPKVAPTKIVIIPCGINDKTDEQIIKEIMQYCQKLFDIFNCHQQKTIIDDRKNYRVGYKFNYWELRGVPFRFEIGPSEVKNNNIKVARRDTGEKININYQNMVDLLSKFSELTDKMGNELFEKAQSKMHQQIMIADNFDLFCQAIQEKNICLVPWCQSTECEEKIILNARERNLSVKSLCIPFDQDLPVKLFGNPENIITESSKCFYCQNRALSYALFGASF